MARDHRALVRKGRDIMFQWLDQETGEVPWTKYFLILALFTMLAFYEIGPGPVSWYITAELFSQSARPVAMGLTSSWNWFHKFIVAMFYQTLLHLVGPYVFLLFTGFLLMAVLYTYFRVPETRGRTFEEEAAEFREADAILTSRF
ncbi:solute carrier family 2, facilitated glucose transporter member 1-like [Natator depressus]|uniref:solute carrier family 2, facilitated glucose transporter member 1-like n=1 Tax=Natator depressus TaxID=27790 RepID=UPI003EB6C91D